MISTCKIIFVLLFKNCSFDLIQVAKMEFSVKA